MKVENFIINLLAAGSCWFYLIKPSAASCQKVDDFIKPSAASCQEANDPGQLSAAKRLMISYEHQLTAATRLMAHINISHWLPGG
jgi:hypothetical protein